MQKVQKQGWGT